MVGTLFTAAARPDNDGDGYSVADGDCNDNNAAIHPGAAEICNGVDDNYNSQIDEGVKITFYRDADGDGFGAGSSTQACTAQAGYVADHTDCNDGNAAIHPGATELCGNGIDDNCNGFVDEGCTSTTFQFTGFFQPVDNSPTLNVVKAGSAMPVKFSLHGNQGLNIFAAGSPTAQPIVCSSGAPLDDIEQTVTASASSLSYNATAGQYTYVWKTDKAWAQSCRQVVVKLTDGSSHAANFKFTK
jgi:hypothetical protein